MEGGGLLNGLADVGGLWAGGGEGSLWPVSTSFMWCSSWTCAGCQAEVLDGEGAGRGKDGPGEGGWAEAAAARTRVKNTLLLSCLVGQGRRGLPVRAPLNPGCLQAPAAAAVLLLTTQRVVVCGTGLVLGEGGHLQRREAVRGWARRARAGVTHNGGAHQLNCRHPHNQILHHQQRPHKKEQNNKFSPRVSAADRPYKNNTTKQR